MHVGRSNRNFKYIMNGSKLQPTGSWFDEDLRIIITYDGKSSGQCLNAYNKAVMILGLNYQQNNHIKRKGDRGESHADTVVWECCKDNQQSQWEILNFDQ